MISQVGLKGLFRLEFVLEEPIDLDQVPLNVLKFVCWHVLRIKHDHVIVENVTLDEGPEVGASATRDAVCGFGDDALVSLHVVVESTQVSRHLCILDLATCLVCEHHEVLVQLVLFLLHRRCCMHSML